MTNSKPENLEDRTFRYAENCKELIKQLPKSITNIEYAKQLARSSGSVAANYVEANESLGKKDFAMRCRISRKEVKEFRLWLKLIDTTDEYRHNQAQLVGESTELLMILSSTIGKSS
ncbi:MAG: four helix bundle protein [Candidatus Saccharimonadales bacterium]|jgi:four helix bundle protein|nr:four helix bundle protein [Candidatus Saccharibacteria bacterium]